MDTNRLPGAGAAGAIDCWCGVPAFGHGTGPAPRILLQKKHSAGAAAVRPRGAFCHGEGGLNSDTCPSLTAHLLGKQRGLAVHCSGAFRLPSWGPTLRPTMHGALQAFDTAALTGLCPLPGAA